jgi:predicted O-methyltransferase YrrM
MSLNKMAVDSAIEKIKEKIPQHKIKDVNLSKFTNSEIDKEFLSYLNGVGGNYMKFVPLLIEELGLKNIVELGNREGLSTLAIYDNLPIDASFITIDIEKDQRYCPDSMFDDRRVKFIFGDDCDLEIFNSLESGVPLNIDFLFSDTIHFDYQLRDEWNIYKYLLADNALVAIDDINLNDKRKLFDELKYDKWDLTEFCHISGWGLFLFQRKEQLSDAERLRKAYQESAKIWFRKYGECKIVLEKIEERKITNKLKKFIRKHSFLHKIIIKFKNLFK